jgi:farnesyl-diphosphate farnesyltransferase
MRVASALPALIGVRTLALLRASPGEPVKVPRAEVRALLWRLALSLGSRARIEREFRQWDNRAR